MPEITDLFLEPSLFPLVTRDQLRARPVVAHCVVDFKCPAVTIFDYSVGVAIDGDVPCSTDLPAEVENIHNTTNVISRQRTAADIDPDHDSLFTVQCFIVGNGCPCNDVINNKIAGQYSIAQLLIDDSKSSALQAVSVLLAEPVLDITISSLVLRGVYTGMGTILSMTD